MIRCAHVVPSINAPASGVAYCVPRLCEALAAEGQEVELHLLEPVPAAAGGAYAIRAHRQWPVLRRLGISPAMRKVLATTARSSQIMHNHSLWMLPNIYPARAVRGTDCRLVLSPHGCFSSYMQRRSRWLKKAVWALGQGNVPRQAAFLHATAEHEHQDIRSVGLKAPVAVIPNGVDLPPETERTAGRSRARRLLYLGRIHPQKGIDTLLRAWARLQAQRPDWELRIVGPNDDEYASRMRALAAELNLERVSFPGPVFADEKSAAYNSADLFVLPSHAENFGMVVAEALAHGVPAVAPRDAPWSGLEREGCGWWIDMRLGPLADCLEEATAKDTEGLLAMGARGRRWMECEFSWQRVGGMMNRTYEWVLGGGPPPEWVVTD